MNAAFRVPSLNQLAPLFDCQFFAGPGDLDKVRDRIAYHQDQAVRFEGRGFGPSHELTTNLLRGVERELAPHEDPIDQLFATFERLKNQRLYDLSLKLNHSALSAFMSLKDIALDIGEGI